MSYLEKIKDYVSQLEPNTQTLAMVAIRDMRQRGEERRTYKGIYTALTKKDKKDWERYGFGLMFHPNFIAQIDKSIARSREAATINPDDFWATLAADEDDSPNRSNSEEWGW